MPDAKDARRAARRDWPVRKYRLGEEPEAAFVVGRTMEENLAALAELSDACYGLTPAGRVRLPRDQWPCRVFYRAPRQPQ